MPQKTIVFIEGRSDKRFIDCLLKDMGIADVIQLEIIGGGVSALKKVRPKSNDIMMRANALQ